MSGFFEGILAWFAKQVLSILLDRAVDAYKDHQKQLELDRQRKEVNEDNLKAYEEAKDRAERTKAALDLINGDATPADVVRGNP